MSTGSLCTHGRYFSLCDFCKEIGIKNPQQKTLKIAYDLLGLETLVEQPEQSFKEKLNYVLGFLKGISIENEKLKITLEPPIEIINELIKRLE